MFFCRMTARDGDGRLETELVFTADNAFKAEAKNHLVVMKEHHPLNWSESHVVEMFLLAKRW